MAKFTFTLQNLLNLKEQKLEEAKITLARIKQDYLGECQEEKKLRAEIAELKQGVFSQKKIYAQDLFLYQQRLKGLQTRLEVCLHRQQILAKELANWRLEVLKRSKEHKVLLKLKQKQWENFVNEQKKQEQKELDEAAILRYTR